MDGSSLFGVYWRVILPLTAPGLVTAAIFAFLGAWNEFLLVGRYMVQGLAAGAAKG